MSAEAASGVIDPLKELAPEVSHLKDVGLAPLSLFGDKAGVEKRVEMFDVSFTNYTLWFIIAAIILLVVVFVFKKKQAAGTGKLEKLTPKGRFVNAIEFLIEFVQKNMIDSVIHHNGRQHFPFIATVFFFILISNFLGLIPGFKTGTGVVGGTLAISFFVFLYFNFVGIKEKGIGGYFKGLVPNGVPGWIAWLVWAIEFISMLLRPITQALRLFANMLAGHLVLGIFALLTSLFLQAAIHNFSLVGPSSILTALPSLAWALLLLAMYVLEVVVAAVQAYVFSLLTAVYIDSATSSH